MISASDLAASLGLPTPTTEQSSVIESGLSPVLVVAGAGSGKTETMAARVVWLLANGLAAPGDILGLTFTRKAAGELAARVQRRIRQLERAGMLPGERDPLEVPLVTTYNAFANGLYRDHAHRLGREPDAAVLTEAAAWILMRRLVVGSSDESLADLDLLPDAITEAALRLSRAIAENRVDPDELTHLVESFGRLAELPRGTAGKSAVMADVASAVRSLDSLPSLARLAREFDAAKRERGAIEFADQVALASEIIERAPSVASELRDRHRIVLLDEYQDTSVAQTRLLATLFHGHPVMAVGDPHQSIYGWRGASAANLRRFSDDFAATPGQDRLTLSVSWRNPRSVLDTANSVIAPFGSAGVGTLEPRPDADVGQLEVVFEETVTEEAERVAEWFSEHLRDEHTSAALLCRTLKQSAPFTEAFDRHRVPYRVLGMGGLLEEPAVADVVCTLRVLRHTDANAELIRLLAGARWRLGVRDLDELGRIAGWLVTRDHARRALDPEVLESVRSSVGADEQRSLVDALEFVASAPTDHTVIAGLSDQARERMRAFARELAQLRARVGLDLVELVATVERTTLLDVEIAARGDGRRARAALEAFHEQVAAFQADDPTADLGAFLSWIAEAERRDALAPRSDEPEDGVVQILTIHGSKGLEWDLVAVVRMVDDELPAAPRTTKGWLSFGELPYEFRADSGELPVLAWRACETQSEFVGALKRFKEAERTRQRDEERRLAYVALTRARTALLLSGSFWSSTVRPRLPSEFLRDAEAAGALPCTLPTESTFETNPVERAGALIPWPRDPLGARRESVERAAELVEHADPASKTGWDDLIDVLLAERDAADAPDGLPTRVPASHFKDYMDDAGAVLAQRRRPMPQRPYWQTRVGTEFHAWVESRFAGGSESLAFDPDSDERDDLDFDRAEGDELWTDASFLDELAPDERDARLVHLQERFTASPWGRRRAEHVELELHLVLDGQIVVCKIDAVFRDGDRYQIVDWKTGVAPTSARDLELRQYQLSLYRLAFARWKGLPPESVDALFYFVADDSVVAPDGLLDEAELIERWSAVREAISPR